MMDSVNLLASTKIFRSKYIADQVRILMLMMENDAHGWINREGRGEHHTHTHILMRHEAPLLEAYSFIILTSSILNFLFYFLFSLVKSSCF